ncbi:MAG: ACP S-malonyltransferase, partial [Elusimicrobia bacterium]|nr:ACP S-malonyltransferase [Elusimicrobiota bacterium]
MVKIAYLFPGQGSQAIGMGKAAAETSADARRLLSQADTILGFSLSPIMFEGPEDKLKDTSITQPALFVASAMALELLKLKGLKPAWVAGHSLGEYSALYAAGALPFETGLKLVRARGQSMSDAGRDRPGAMAAILGLDAAKVEHVCQQASAVGVCAPANFNSESQIVISGESGAVAKAMELAQTEGASKVVALAVSGAFHSPLMSGAAQRMKKFIDEASMLDATVPVITNVDAVPTTAAGEFKKKLFQQIDHPVRWHESMKKLIELGAETFIEVGTGRVLSTMAKKLDRKKASLATDDMESIEKA